MGMYTEFVFACRLDKGTPSQIIDVLGYMVRENEKVDTPDNVFFRCERWDVLFIADSYYFDGETNTILKYDEISKQYSLTVRSNLKNYDDEIKKFLKWMKPFIDACGHQFLGYYRYEENEEPILIYYDEIESEDK